MPTPLEDPDAVTVAETGVGHFQVEVIAPGATFLADEPERAGGLGSGPIPTTCWPRRWAPAPP